MPARKRSKKSGLCGSDFLKVRILVIFGGVFCGKLWWCILWQAVLRISIGGSKEDSTVS